MRGSQWADGGERFATVCDAFGPHPAKVQVFFAPEDADPETRESSLVRQSLSSDRVVEWPIWLVDRHPVVGLVM